MRDPHHERPARGALAAQLREAAAALQTDRVAVASLVQAHGPAAQGSLLLLMAVPCLLPVPGTGTVLGFGVLALAVALWRGQCDAVLPERVTALEMPLPWARRVLATLASIYEFASRVARTRAYPGRTGAAEAWLAVLVAAMAVLLILPIPFGNVLPALALIVIGLGLAFRDGVLVALGALSAVITAAAMSALLVAGAAWGIEWAGLS